MPIDRNEVGASRFNADIHLPFELRLRDFESALQDIYEFFL